MSNEVQVLTLRTLGGVYIADEQGQPLTGAASQRRLLALLVVLAFAGERGLSRDKLIALLWPEAGEERARHSLTQALYAARRALDAEDLFEGRGDLRLNRERLRSDVREFEEALEAGDDERAAAAYSRPICRRVLPAGLGRIRAVDLEPPSTPGRRRSRRAGAPRAPGRERWAATRRARMAEAPRHHPAARRLDRRRAHGLAGGRRRPGGSASACAAARNPPP